MRHAACDNTTNFFCRTISIYLYSYVIKIVIYCAIDVLFFLLVFVVVSLHSGLGALMHYDHYHHYVSWLMAHIRMFMYMYDSFAQLMYGCL